MRYACLIYGDEKVQEAQDESVRDEYMKLATESRASGVLIGGEPLDGSETATTVRVRDGKRQTTDGPFAETKEVLGGFFLIDVPTIDEALEFASRIPGARYGSIEVRPLLDMPG